MIEGQGSLFGRFLIFSKPRCVLNAPSPTSSESQARSLVKKTQVTTRLLTDAIIVRRQ